MSIKQKTIQNEISLEGVGLHTGKKVKLTFKPAVENSGFTFVRTDLEGEPSIEAHANYVTDTQRGTNLEKNGVIINTSEHVLAAIVGCDLDNITIEMDSPEPPILDGSSKFFVEALEASRRVLGDDHPERVGAGACPADAVGHPDHAHGDDRIELHGQGHGHQDRNQRHVFLPHAPEALDAGPSRAHAGDSSRARRGRSPPTTRAAHGS